LTFWSITVTISGTSWSWSYGSWIDNYLCNQCLSPLKLWVRTSFMRRCTRCNIMWFMTIFFRCLDGIGKSGESSSEYLTLYKRLIQPAHWKYYLAIKGVMLHLGLRQVSGFLWFPLPIKLTATIKLKYCWKWR
jgi:hypothetical protein